MREAHSGCLRSLVPTIAKDIHDFSSHYYARHYLHLRDLPEAGDRTCYLKGTHSGHGSFRQAR
jgi:hypothetical protein